MTAAQAKRWKNLHTLSPWIPRPGLRNAKEANFDYGIGRSRIRFAIHVGTFQGIERPHLFAVVLEKVTENTSQFWQIF